jgi:ATP-dependent Lon protease
MEKTIAAPCAGLRVLFFPEGNRKDFTELPDYLNEWLEVPFAGDYGDVKRTALANG